MNAIKEGGKSHKEEKQKKRVIKGREDVWARL